MVEVSAADPADAAPITVDATVKWYSNSKGVGFVAPRDGAPEALLYRSVLIDTGFAKLSRGDTLTCEIGDTARGRQVTRVLAVHRSTEPKVESAFRSTTRPLPRPDRQRSLPADGTAMSGTVKFYDAWRGFGFVIPDQGEQDVYVTARTLEQTGLAALQQHQRVRFVSRSGPKGPVAILVEAA